MVQRKVPNKQLGYGLQADHVKTNHDLKNGSGADLKKKMKKSGSIKRQELDSRRQVKQPGKPPPNYMKSTTSSDARKEQTQVSMKSPDSSSLIRKNSNISKLGLASGNKATKTLARTSSLKMMRTLTKNPSFKPARASVRKCSPVVLCENLDSGRATCSSTLKDCKFPAYLSLNPGGTESEGTSTIKVCPYTYCSLNGHHHAPLPPLKCFLSAKRRMIKTQRSVKLECLSPRRVKPIGDDSSLIEDEQKDFFIEIYSKKNEEATDCVGIYERDETAADDREERVVETLSDAPICYDVDVNESVDENGDADSMDIGTEKNQEVKVDEEVSDMEWEIGHQSALHVDYDYDYDYENSNETEIEPDHDAREVESRVVYDDDSDKSGGCFNELELSEGSFDEESLNLDAFSNSDDSESTGSYDYLQSLKDMETSEPEPADDDKKEILSECHTPRIDLPLGDQVTGSYNTVKEETSSYNLKHESPQNEDAIAKCKKSIEDTDELGLVFNPREPNFLPVEPDPESEKIDLRHQDLDERKNAEEWMIDYALRQTVTKLGQARKRKVSMLVEAFEKVMPITKCELHLRHTSAFDQTRPIQACS